MKNGRESGLVPNGQKGMSGLFQHVLAGLPATPSARFRSRNLSLIEKVEGTGLFDPDFYRETYPDVRASGADPIVHFLRVGAREGRMPNPLFDPAFYVRSYPEVGEARANPLVHYLDFGAAEGRKPHPLFETGHYLSQPPAVADSDMNPLAHYLKYGARSGRDPNPYFDTAYYLRECPDLGEKNPLRHFCASGASAGRKPNRLFDPAYYVRRNEDVRAVGVNPLAHFLEAGDLEHRRPGPLFDPKFYLREYADVEKTGMPPLMHYLRHGAREGRVVNPQQYAVHAGQKLSAARLAQIRAEIRLFRYTPRISILTPVYNQTPALLERAIASVRAQAYENWELCLADDGSTSGETLETLKRYLDPLAGRINVAFLGRNNGISGATNAALYLSTGDFVAMLDHDDELAPDALFEIAKALNSDPELDVLYSDEDKLQPGGWLEQPFYKPDWSPELFRHVMYAGHLLCVRRTLALAVRGMDKRFDGVQDFDFLLRVSERTGRIGHIPKILYHWRSIPGSIALGADEKPHTGDLQTAAVNAHLERRGVAARAECHPALPHRVVIRPVPGAAQPRVSIVIPTRDQPAALEACLRSIFEKTTYTDFEVILVDNGTTDQAALALFRKYRVTVAPHPGVFNFSRANNLGARQASGEFLVLLNNDTEVITPGWLQELVFCAGAAGVAAVSPLLLYPDRSVQHAGVVLGMRGTADHVMRGFPADSDGYFGSLSCTREVSAVTAACMMLRRETYLQAGGFREEFRTIYQDLDLCLRLRAQGGRILYTPRAMLYHHESLSRGKEYDSMDRALLLDFWGKVIASGDPYFNCNLDAQSVTPKLLAM